MAVRMAVQTAVAWAVSAAKAAQHRRSVAVARRDTQRSGWRHAATLRLAGTGRLGEHAAMTLPTRPVLALLALFAIALLLSPHAAATWLSELNAHGHRHLHAHGHPFADARSWLGIPNAADTLSNLPFALLAVWTWRVARREADGVARQAYVLLATGLLGTAIGSSLYHLWPSAWTLVLDRAGMVLAFAGVLVLASAQRFSRALGDALLRGLPPLALIAAVLPAWPGWLLPWLLVQGGGMVWVLAMACRKPLQGSPRLGWGWLIAGYALAKLLEAGDLAIYEATGQLVSGHTLKHLVAAAAVLPLLLARR
jgi:hypothetical protein